MRYLGNKQSILPEIDTLLEEKKLNSKNYVFFDAFAGTGSVADHLKDNFNIIVNDNLTWSVIYSLGKINYLKCNFNKLGFNPFYFLNSNREVRNGFIYKTYAPTESKRMYFTDYNAGRIDYFRLTIEMWKNSCLISTDEYNYLIASLIESVSSVSNTAGVYGAYLKTWDKRALKEIIFEPVAAENKASMNVKFYNSKIEDIIEDVECDILYLDPPYTQNQYGTQYHLLETLVLNDNPSVSKITGSRPVSPMRSDWSKEYKANILFDRVIAKTKAKYIIFSYNNDGLMSKGYIDACLKRYAKSNSFMCKKIPYKKYLNWKTNNSKEHFEYLYFIEKNDDIIYECPLNYIGSKNKSIREIKTFFPSNIKLENFIDLFGGGFNVGINSYYDCVIYNDINSYVKELIESFKTYDTYDYLMYINKIIKKFNLEKGNKENYLIARDFYNSTKLNRRDPRFLFTIILYGFNQQIRFNSLHEFNNPAGIRWFNDNVLEKFVSFSRRIKEMNVRFESKDYLELNDTIKFNSFTYVDPPYLLTLGSYNDGKRGFKGWCREQENELFEFLDNLTQNNKLFMLSYVIEHKGLKNTNICDWIKRNNYNLITLSEVKGISGSSRKEILVTNYGY